MPVDYARLAKDYDAARGDEAVDRGFWLPALVEAARLRDGERVLDLGAGTGRFARLLGERHPVVAADRSADMLREARAKGVPDLVRADAHALPFRRDAFDAAFLVMVVHQLADYRMALREVARVARRAAIATTDMRRRDLGVLEEAFPSLRAVDLARFPATEDLVEALERAGFRSVDVEVRPYRRTLTVARELDRVRRKYISTLDLLPPGEFERGLAFLERELPRRYGEAFETSSVFTFVGASR